MEDLDFSGLLACYSDRGRTGFNPIMLYAVVTYVNMYGLGNYSVLLIKGNDEKQEFKNCLKFYRKLFISVCYSFQRKKYSL